VVARAEQAGVDRILAVGSDLGSSCRALHLAQRFGCVYAAVGVHPHEADRFEDEAEGVRALLRESKVVAVGEIGLDYYRKVVDKDRQMMAFREQARWARDAGLPASVHNREADADVLEVLSETGARGVLHCFSGSWAFARAALDAGLFLSFAGNLTYPKAADLRDVAAQAPGDRLLVETDSPVLAPQRWRGKRNEPAYVVATLDLLAAERRVPPPDLADQITANADGLFSWRGR